MAYLSPAEVLRIAGLRPQLRAIVLPFMQAVEDATGKKITITSGARSYAQQAKLYADRANNPNPVAPPGTSRHEFAAAFDFSIANGTDDDYRVAADIAEQEFGLIAGYYFNERDKNHLEIDEAFEASQAAFQPMQQQRTSFAVLATLAVVVALMTGVLSLPEER